MDPLYIPDPATLRRPHHVKYWLRCLKTHLPTLYQENDSSRMALAFFILSALDLLDALHTHTSDGERMVYIDWIYRCQHPDGGFRGFTGADMGSSRNERNKCWDPATLAATYFALATLVVLQDNMERFEVAKCSSWLRQLQLDDGSFGEARAAGGRVEGGQDVRFCYCAAAVRWISRHCKASAVGTKETDINIENLKTFVLSLQVSGMPNGPSFVTKLKTKTFEGGVGNTPFHEAHAGWTYCGIGTLKLLDLVPTSSKGNLHGEFPGIGAELPSFIESLTHWLVSRQTPVDRELAVFEFADDEAAEPPREPLPNLFPVQGAVISPTALSGSCTPLSDTYLGGLPCAGFNGRCNKTSDTCYSFWMLNRSCYVDVDANRQFLLEKTQHIIGGFGKLPGVPPDIMHSYLGLAALAALGEPGLKTFDSALCLSVSATERLKARAH